MRIAIGKPDNRYKLMIMVELDEGLFTKEVQNSEKGNSLKKGHGSQRKINGLVIVETVESNPTEKEHKFTAVKHIKTIVIDDLKVEFIGAKAKENNESSSTIISNHFIFL